MTKLICKLATPQDDRNTASDVVSLEYIADAEYLRDDARSIADRGHAAVKELMDEGVLSGVIPGGCHVPERFSVTIQSADGTTKVVRPSY